MINVIGLSCIGLPTALIMVFRCIEQHIETEYIN